MFSLDKGFRFARILWDPVVYASNNLTGGHGVGNLTVAWIGSYEGEYRLKNIDCCAGTAQIRFRILNKSGRASGTRFPKTGWSLLNDTDEGMGANITQYFEWTEPLTFRPPPQIGAAR